LELVAGCDPRPERRAWAEQQGVRATYPDALTLLEREKPELILIATPPDSHRDLCVLALQHGAHVLCEKPFITRLEEADDVAAAAAQAGRNVVVNNQYRYLDTYLKTKQALARGDFGRPYLIQAWQQMYHPPYQEKNWRSRLTQSTLYEFGSHPLDLFSYFFDALAQTITAHIPKVRHDTEADVLVQATLRYPNERMATLMMNRVSRAPQRYLEMRVDCEEASLRLSFGGIARATVEWSREARRPVFRASFVKGGEARVEQGGRSRVLAYDQQEGRPMATARLLTEMIANIRAGRISLDAMHHARALARTVFGGYESARRGETISIATFTP
jgi:predicted dehydrogenase